MKTIAIIFLVILLSLPAIFSLFKPGFFPTHDGEWMVIRLTDFHRSFVSGQIPVRWAARLNYNFGYPVFDFLYPLAFYLGEFFHLMGFSFVNSVKLVFIVSFLFSGIFMYLFARELWGTWGGVVSAVFYTYAPYRFLDVYVRGSIGEAMSFVFAPLIFLSIYKLAQRPSRRYMVVGSLALSGLIMSHNIMAMLFGPFIIIAILLDCCIAKRERKKLILRGLLLISFSLGLSAFFWLPAFFDKQFIVLDQVTVANFWEHFPSLRQLFIPGWGYGPSTTGTSDQVSYQLGLVHLLAVLFSVVVLARLKARESFLRWQIVFYLLVFLTGLFFMLPVSTLFWRLVPMLWRAQFPWRFLGITTYGSAVLAGSAALLFKSRVRIIVIGIVIALAIAANYSYAKPSSYVDRGEDYYTTNEATTTVMDEFMPVWVEQKPVRRPSQKVEVISGKGEIKNLVFNSKRISFNFKAETDSEIQINTLYFPGWRVKVDDQITSLLYRNGVGVIKFEVGAGEHKVVAEFGETPLRLVSDGISLLSLAVIAGLWFSRKGVVKFVLPE